jgi:hypothetical protein
MGGSVEVAEDRREGLLVVSVGFVFVVVDWFL